MKKLAICGTSHRAIRLWVEANAAVKTQWEIVALWDIDPKRFDAFEEMFPEIKPQTFLGDENYETMLQTCSPDMVIVCTRDNYHADYAVRTLAYDIDIMIEKPMVTTVAESITLLEAAEKSKGQVYVTFNYRYQNTAVAVKEMLDTNKVGRVTAIELNVYLDEIHGSSFFMRWNRLRKNSGGLSIHKEGHYLDMINWWIDQNPVEVYCFGTLNYYGPEGALNPAKKEGRHCSTCSEAAACAYNRIRQEKETSDDHIKGLQGRIGSRAANTDYYTNYAADQCIFDSEIDIEDTYAAVIKYDGGAVLSFSVNFSSPFEQHRVVINGTHGRIEDGYTFADDQLYTDAALAYYPLFEKQAKSINIKNSTGGHAGGDPALMQDILCNTDKPHIARAGLKAGTYAVAIGEAMWRSAQTGLPVKIKDLLGDWDDKLKKIEL